MKFKNTGEITKVRLVEGDGYKWITVKKDAEVDLPEKIGVAYKFEKLKEEKAPKKSKKQSKKK